MVSLPLSGVLISIHYMPYVTVISFIISKLLMYTTLPKLYFVLRSSQECSYTTILKPHCPKFYILIKWESGNQLCLVYLFIQHCIKVPFVVICHEMLYMHSMYINLTNLSIVMYVHTQCIFWLIILLLLLLFIVPHTLINGAKIRKVITFITPLINVSAIVWNLPLTFRVSLKLLSALESKAKGKTNA